MAEAAHARADPVAILQALIRCPSVTPEEGGALHYLATLLGEAGFATDVVRFSEPGTPDVDNLFARVGEGAPHLVFAGHTDVVPPGDLARWRFDPFSAEIAEGMIFGRGAADMKGGIAAFAAAALEYVQRSNAPRGSLSLLITGDEEGPAINGTVKLLQWAAARGERFTHCIVGEPTNPDALGDMIKIGRRGSLNAEIVVVGRQGHSAYPHLAENPLPTMARLVTALSDLALDRGNAHFDRSQLVVTSVDVGNAAFNVIPGEARARFNVRFNDLWTPDTLRDRLEAVVREAAGNAKAELICLPCNSLAFITKPDAFVETVSRAIEAETGRTPVLSTSGGTSDARFIRDYCPVVEFGLVGQTMHAFDERVAVDDLHALARIYGRIIEEYFAQKAASPSPTG
ncbi:MAG: succinyl-diaminopimelate desuccinylase [Methylobacteriaceae bacterium]|nr:succinyl-diaminopimelate desuccinylase [Methylobacteriaceae bacterium]